jgi:hypothetical protein
MCKKAWFILLKKKIEECRLSATTAACEAA